MNITSYILSLTTLTQPENVPHNVQDQDTRSMTRKMNKIPKQDIQGLISKFWASIVIQSKL